MTPATESFGGCKLDKRRGARVADGKVGGNRQNAMVQAGVGCVVLTQLPLYNGRWSAGSLHVMRPGRDTSAAVRDTGTTGTGTGTTEHTG